MLDEYGVTDRCYINSFSGDILNYVYTKYENRIRLHGYFPVRLLGEYFSENFLSAVPAYAFSTYLTTKTENRIGARITLCANSLNSTL